MENRGMSHNGLDDLVPVSALYLYLTSLCKSSSLHIVLFLSCSPIHFTSNVHCFVLISYLYHLIHPCQLTLTCVSSMQSQHTTLSFPVVCQAVLTQCTHFDLLLLCLALDSACLRSGTACYRVH